MTETPQQTLTEKERAVLSLIPVGADNLRNGRYICQVLNMSIRTFRDIIQRLIVRYGVPIVAKRGLVSGYYIPVNEQERLDGIKELNAQHQQEYRRLNALINADLNRHKELMTDEAIEQRI